MRKLLVIALFAALALPVLAQEYVDLGLPSGTKWKSQNEEGYYTFEQATSTFENTLPTAEQWVELKDVCTWNWAETKDGFHIVGPNGNAIFLPITGYRNCEGEMCKEKWEGDYWSSTLDDLGLTWYLTFGSVGALVLYEDRCSALSIRLVDQSKVIKL